MDPTASPGEGGVDSRLAALVRETDRNENGAVRGVCSGRADRRDGRVGTKRSGSFWILEGKNDESCLERGNQEGDSARGRNNRHRIERQASLRTTHGIWTKATVGERRPPNFWQ